ADNLTTGSNNIVIGYDIDAPSATGSNRMSIGNLIFGTGIDGTGASISSGAIGIATTTPGGTYGEKLTVTGSEYVTGNLTVGQMMLANGYVVASLPASCTPGAVTRATDSDDCSSGGGNGSLCVCNNAGNGWVLLLNY
ncbi:MAG TPA: hypothetical protein PLK76_03010, partial [bacterium]|nr:hypothetical protein [bacterium]